MERPVPLPRGTRPRARHYYEGFVDKRVPGDQGYRRVWAGLRGLKLAFYRGSQDHEVPGLLRAGSPGLGAPHGLSRPDPRGFSGPGPPRDPPRLETPPGWDPSGWDPQDKNLWVGLGGGSPRPGLLGSAGAGTPKIETPHPVRAPKAPLGQDPPRVGPLCPFPKLGLFGETPQDGGPVPINPPGQGPPEDGTFR